MQEHRTRPDQELEERLSPLMDEQENMEEIISGKEVQNEETKWELLDSMSEEKSIESLDNEIDGKDFQGKDADDEMRKELALWKKRVHELEAELEKKNESERMLLESLFSQTKQLEQAKMCLEESKFEIGILNSNGEDENAAETKAGPNVGNAFDGMRREVELLKQNLARAEEGEKQALSRAESLNHEVSVLKNELKLAMEAEERSSGAMDGLASALKEVTTELNKVREELNEAESEMVKMRSGVSSKEEKLELSLEDARKEANQFKNTAERLKYEAEETLMAWNEKEVSFISCIKKVEEERASAQKENKRLIESLLQAEKMTRTTKDETHKLRDILKQALNEANAAKEAAGIAKRENSQLKDCMMEKDSALDFLTLEYEKLKRSETAARESVIELKRMLHCSSKPIEDDHNKDEQNGSPSRLDHDRSIEPRVPGRLDHAHSTEPRIPRPPKTSKTMSFDLTELHIPPKPILIQTDPLANLDPEIAETLRGSIFDTESTSPPHARTPAHGRKKSSSVYTDDSDTMVTDEECDHPDGPHFDEHGNRIRKRALLRRFGDLLIRKSVGHHQHHHRRIPSSVE